MKLYCKLCKCMNTSQKLKKVKLIIPLACDHLSPEYLATYTSNFAFQAVPSFFSLLLIELRSTLNR